MTALCGRNFLFAGILILALMALSCSSGPQQAQPGTPKFHWDAARTTYQAGDYARAQDNLGEVMRSDNEFTARALPWRLVLLSGLTKGYAELADLWETGAGANRANPAPFRTQLNTYRRQGGQLALQFAETLQKFEAAAKGKPVSLAFALPAGSAAEIPQLKRVSSGILIPEAESAALQKRVLERAVLLAACRAVGAAEDAAKAQQLFQSQPVTVQWPVFAAALAQSLYDQSQLFIRDHLDRPDRLEFFAKKALEMLKDVPEGKESKALRASIEKALKKR